MNFYDSHTLFNIDINNLTLQCYNAKNDVTSEKMKNSEKIVKKYWSGNDKFLEFMA